MPYSSYHFIPKFGIAAPDPASLPIVAKSDIIEQGYFEIVSIPQRGTNEDEKEGAWHLESYLEAATNLAREIG